MKINPAPMQLNQIEKGINSIPRQIKNIWKRWFFFTVAIFFVFIILIIAVILIYGEVYANKIYPGISVGYVDLGGHTFAEARQLLINLTAGINKDGILFIAKTESQYKETRITPTVISASDPDLSREILFFTFEKTLDKAWQIGRQNDFLTRLEEQFNALFYGYNINLDYQIDDEEFEKILKENFQELESQGQDAKLIIENEKAKVGIEVPGNSFNYKTAVDSLKLNLKIFDFEPINLALKADVPKIRAGDTLLALAKANNILAATTTTILEYQDKTWEINQKNLGNWLEFRLVGAKKRIDLGLNQASTTAFLETIAQEINVETKDAKFQLATSTEKEMRVMEFQTSRDGLKVDLEQSYKKIEQEILKKNNHRIGLIVNVTKPQRPTEDINEFGIRELIGVGESNFAGSPKNRRHNIKIGAEKLNGLLIKPGEEFSLVQALGSINAEAGYLPELVIKGNRTIPEYGGGLCQIGTTTFRAALYSGLPITERRPHSYRVSYYEPAGMDATIYNPRPDLKFINNTGNYILFITEIEGDILKFKFYGTKDGRKIEIENPPRIWKITHPGPTKIIETLDLKPGEKNCTERAHNGADAEFSRKVVYNDGRELIDEKWFSRYVPWQAVCLVGVEKLSNATSTEATVAE